ncbi:MAG: XdhC family protein [Acidobacteriota bacterium]
MKNIYQHLLSRLERKEPVALAAIINSHGSTPQVPGSSAIISEEGLLEGTLGGGTLEFDIQEKTKEALKKQQNQLVKYNLNAGISAVNEPICGGTVDILINSQPEIHRRTWEKMNLSLKKRKPGILATVIKSSGSNDLNVSRIWAEEKSFSELTKTLQLKKDKISHLFSRGVSATLIPEEKKLHQEKSDTPIIFIEPLFPLQRLLIAGAGHVGKATAHLGSFLEFEVTVLDDRPEFANKERIPEADNFLVEDIAAGIKNFLIDQDTYIVIVTRGHQKDAQALRECVASKAAYVGMIGSSRKVALMKEKFLKEGWATPEQWEKVYAPIGLEIGSKTVEEIALSIAAQLVQIRCRQRQGQ